MVFRAYFYPTELDGITIPSNFPTLFLTPFCPRVFAFCLACADSTQHIVDILLKWKAEGKL